MSADAAATPSVAAALAAQRCDQSHAVQLVETHISSVILAGAHAWKLKKPIRLPFLDFSTVAARRACCLEELRLNRRTAPQLYECVRPVLGPPDAPRLGDPVDPAADPDDEPSDAAAAIDWAVQMRRFDDRQTLDHVAARGELTPELIDRMAEALAGFHTGLMPCADDLPPAADTARHWADDNLDSLRSMPAAAGWSAELARLQHWCRMRLEQLDPLMRQRQQTGAVRECHGDLHLGNWVLLDGAPVMFDAIEFNPQLRWIDVISDLAFPFMDLHAHGRPDLAWRLASAWFERSGDYAGAPLLVWFAVYRALVRAKVALIEAAQHGNAGTAAALAERAGRFVRVALELAAQADRPALLIGLGGLSGSGKSTVAQMAVELVGALRLRSDVERKRLHGLRPQQRPGRDGAPPAAQLYSREATERTYAHLHELTAQLLRAGISVVFDAACLRASERAERRQLAATHGARHLLLHCSAPPDVLEDRLRARTWRDDDASDAGIDVMQRQRDQEEPLADDEPEVLRIETDRPLPALHEQLWRGLWGAGALLAGSQDDRAELTHPSARSLHVSGTSAPGS